MGQSLTNMLVHVIFSTKDRYPFLDPPVRPEMHAYAATILKKLDSPALIVNGVADHIHFLCHLSKKLAICDLIEEVKTGTSKWIKTKGGILAKFYWQNGYGAFSVSQSSATTVCRYIKQQETHHKRVAFQDEFRRFLQRHKIEYDEKYIWE